MDTAPMQLDELGAAPGGVDDFRVSSPPEVAALLRRLLDASAQLHLNTPQGAVYTTSLWAIDAPRGVVSFSADGNELALQRILNADEVTVVAYLDSIKLQFELTGLVLVRGERTNALNGRIPRVLYRFQRRNSFRVRPLARSAPTATFAHPMIPDMELSLRVLDVSIGGCALHLPDDVPPLEPGVRINGVVLELDASTRVRTAIVLHHVSAIGSEVSGRRLGCEFAATDGNVDRTLQHFVDQVEKRRRMLGRG
jgi:c-di-GMP-binding flagellar brake protein YcgR